MLCNECTILMFIEYHYFKRGVHVHPLPTGPKELIPIHIAAALWCHEWIQSCVRFRCDNMPVVDLLRSRTSKEQLVMHLLCCLVFYAAIFRFEFLAQHIPGILNTAADAISCNKISLFVYLIPQIPLITITQAIVELLIMK